MYLIGHLTNHRVYDIPVPLEGGLDEHLDEAFIETRNADEELLKASDV